MPKFYTEPGVAIHKFSGRERSQSIYSTLEMAGTLYGDRGFLLLAPKLGYQYQFSFLTMGLEIKYLSDGRNNDVVLAPKAGFSFRGIVDLMYGYQLSFKGYLPGVGAHQFSLALTLYRKGFSSR